jgi:integral membrane sensor domain MASE1
VAGRILGAVLVGVAYFGFAELGHVLSVEPGYVATCWPASGLLLAVLLKLDYRHWWLPMLMAAAGNMASDMLLHGKHLPVAMALIAANQLEASAGASLLKYLTRPRGLRCGVSRTSHYCC